MNKKFIAIPALLIAIGGGAVFAQSDLFVQAVNNPSISAGEAKKIALKQLDGEIISFEFDADDRTPHYEIDIVKDNEKIEVKVDADTGKAVVTERENIRTITTENPVKTDGTEKATDSANNSSIITEEQAIEIAQAKAKGTVTDIELDEDDNRLIYEIEIRNGKMEYDFEIDAKTGDIIKYEEDLDDDRFED
ncbi:PepSY domain-containing protein [Solibacillus sp. FSL W7-1324]|uniref:PepSY domain-containing protein n=1 Tax=Solibacillus sp. FSL W7-1324 TaxID=2921701 RepID=UPI0030FC152E